MLLLPSAYRPSAGQRPPWRMVSFGASSRGDDEDIDYLRVSRAWLCVGEAPEICGQRPPWRMVSFGASSRGDDEDIDYLRVSRALMNVCGRELC